MIKLMTACQSLLLLLIIFAVTDKIVEGRCVLAVRGGGCPDTEKCREVCSACYRGVGQIWAFCRPAGGGIPFDECMCDFRKGAPCSPPGMPKCPPSLSFVSTRWINVTPTHL